MSKRVTVEELAANLSEHLADVKRGESFSVFEDGNEVATLSPGIASMNRGVRFPFRNLSLNPSPKTLTSDPAAIIIEERELERSGKKHGV